MGDGDVSIQWISGELSIDSIDSRNRTVLVLYIGRPPCSCTVTILSNSLLWFNM